VQQISRFGTHFKSAFTVDTVIFGFDGEALNVLLVQRSESPFKGSWALPGDFVSEREALPGAAHRVLLGFSGQADGQIDQLHTFGAPDRHALGRVITIAYRCLIYTNNFAPRRDVLQRHICWRPVDRVGSLAYDHRQILDRALDQLREDFHYQTAAFSLLPPEFTLGQLRKLYESVWDTDLEKRNFRKKILATPLLTDLNRLQRGVAHRPARLYRFDQAHYAELRRSGYRLNL
jgi:8-oxo-dGTP diphosphatase